MTDQYDEVLFEEMSGTGGNLGIITLNRANVLNSLNHSMIKALHSRLKSWASESNIKAVIIRAADGRAFCAGGDLRSTYDRFRTNDSTLPLFFHDEYQLNRFIFHFPKPYIALLDGITMGGGVGISIHGSHRVATDRLLFAMPETGIGFFPDVGGTYFLPRLPGKIGFYLGLTGARITSDDCVALGLTPQKVAREELTRLIHALAQEKFTSDAKMSVTRVIEQFKIATDASPLMEQHAAIDKCFSADTMENIIRNLSHCSNSFCQDALTHLAKKSPTSLKVTLHALQEGKRMDFDACMQQEFRLVCRFLQGHDFTEGIRAVIIDKDQKPHWKPDSIEKVSQKEVEHYFAPLGHELELS